MDHVHFGLSLSCFVIWATTEICAINLVDYNHILVGHGLAILLAMHGVCEVFVMLLATY